jgi:hypothetical protein
LAIALVINCELCGLSVQGDTEPEVLEKASEHMVERHPEAADDSRLMPCELVSSRFDSTSLQETRRK